MPTLNNLLDKAKDVCKLPSDMALGERLHVSRSAVSLWRKGGIIREEHLAALVQLAKAEPAIAVQIMSEQARTAPEKSVWGALARQLGVAATVAAVTLAGWLPAPAQAANGVAEPAHALCIMRSLRALARKLQPWRVLRTCHASPALLA